MIQAIGFESTTKRVKATQLRDALKVTTNVYKKIVVEFDTTTIEIMRLYLDDKITFSEYRNKLYNYFKSL